MKSRIAYQPGDSLLHRLHPLTKGAWLLFGTVFVFAVRNPWVILATLGLVTCAFFLTGFSLGGIRGTWLFASTALLLGALQLLFVRQGDELLRAGPLVVTSGGIEAGIYVAGRFLSVIVLSYLFVLSTDPNDLAYGLMRAGLPYRYGFALIMALRLAPVFEQEAHIVYQAQLARGVRYDARSPRRFLTLARQFFMPLLVSALGKVDGLAVSMEGRCFGKYPTRTFFREVHPTRQDGIAAILLLASIAATVALLIY